MAITIESANKALTRNGLGHLTLIKNGDTGAIMLINAENPEDVDAALIFKDDAGGTVSRVRDLTVTTVMARAKELNEHIQWRTAFRAKVNAESVDEGDIPVTSYSPVTAAEIAATGQQDLRQNAAALVALVASGDLPVLKPKRTVLVTGAALRGNLIPATDAVDAIPNGNPDRRWSLTPRTDNVAHVDNRSKVGVFPQQIGRAVRPVTANVDVTQRNREELQQFAKAQNEAFIGTIPNAPAGFQILRSGDLRVTITREDGGGPSHTWKLRDLGMRFMRDKSPAWWVGNAERLALGYLPEDAGPVLTQARVKQHALTLETIRDIANRNGRFAYLIVDDFGKSEAKQSRDLRDAFRRINQGERVFIHSADLKRYDRELKEGKHGDPRGALDL